MKIFDNITQLIGKTPLISLDSYCKSNKINARIYAKLEMLNPIGSIKDRVALAMIETAEKEGLLKEGTTIIEPTSGNTGIGLAAIGVSRGYKVILTMPETMSIERRKLVEIYGASVVLTSGKEGMKGAIEKAQELSNQIENSFIPSQFENMANVNIHKKTTGVEIWEDTNGKIDILVAGVGTGGTITGTGTYLKKQNPNIKIVAVEPDKSPVLSGGTPSPHKIQGIGAGFVPKILDRNIIDEIITVSADDAYNTLKKLAKTQGILAGISSGAALYAAEKLSKQNENKNIVVILPDTGERYLSTL